MHTTTAKCCHSLRSSKTHAWYGTHKEKAKKCCAGAERKVEPDRVPIADGEIKSVGPSDRGLNSGPTSTQAQGRFRPGAVPTHRGCLNPAASAKLGCNCQLGVADLADHVPALSPAFLRGCSVERGT